MDREGRGFTFLQKKFPRISVEKVKAGILDRSKKKKKKKDS